MVYLDGVRHFATNVELNGKVTDYNWENSNRPDLAYTYNTCTCDSSGGYTMTFSLPNTLGTSVINGTNYGDNLNVKIDYQNSLINYPQRNFFIIKYTSQY